MGRPVNFRFRNGKDEELEEAFNQELENSVLDKSDLIRAALSEYLFNDEQGKRLSGPVKNRDRSLDDTELGELDLEQKEKTDGEIEDSLDSILEDF